MQVGANDRSILNEVELNEVVRLDFADYETRVEIVKPEVGEICKVRLSYDIAGNVRIRLDCVANRSDPIDIVSDAAGIENEGDSSLTDLSS